MKIKTKAYRLHVSVRCDECGLPGLFAHLLKASGEPERAAIFRDLLFRCEFGKSVPDFAKLDEAPYSEVRSVSFRFNISERDMCFQDLMQMLALCRTNIERTALIKRRLSKFLQGADAQAATEKASQEQAPILPAPSPVDPAPSVTDFALAEFSQEPTKSQDEEKPKASGSEKLHERMRWLRDGLGR